MRAIVVAGSPQPESPGTVQPADDDLLIAVDLGGSHCLRWGWQPSVVIGDLDSLPARDAATLRARGSRFITAPTRKDETDLELALDFAVQAGAREIVIVAGWGGRIDQSLANVLLLTRPNLRGLAVRLAEGYQTVRLVQPDQPVWIKGQVGDVLSLVPVDGNVDGVAVDAVEWPLHGEPLPLGSTRGISNVLTGGEVGVRVARGRLLVVHSARPETDPPTE